MNRFKLFEDFESNGNSFGDLIGWIEEIYPWDYVETEGQNRVRFDWRNGQLSFWLNDDMTGEGDLPSSVKRKVEERGIKIA